MKTTKTTSADITLCNFGFDPREVEMMHRQFSGERSTFITGLDDVLRNWGMASSVNPHIHFTYQLIAETSEGVAVKRVQHYLAEHVDLWFTLANEPLAMAQPKALIHEAANVLKVYDNAFAVLRAEIPAWAMASYYALREVFARIAPQAVFAEAEDNKIFIIFEEGENRYTLRVKMKYFSDLEIAVEEINKVKTN